MWFWCQSFEHDTNVSINEDKKYTGRLLYPMYGHSTYMRNADLEKRAKCSEKYSHTKINNFMVLTL